MQFLTRNAKGTSVLLRSWAPVRATWAAYLLAHCLQLHAALSRGPGPAGLPRLDEAVAALSSSQGLQQLGQEQAWMAA